MTITYVVLSTVLTARRVRSYVQLIRPDDRGEGVISTAIAVPLSPYR